MDLGKILSRSLRAKAYHFVVGFFVFYNSNLLEKSIKTKKPKQLKIASFCSEFGAQWILEKSCQGHINNSLINYILVN